MTCIKCHKDRFKSFDADFVCCVNCGTLALIPAEPMQYDQKRQRAKVPFSATPSRDIIYQYHDSVIAVMRLNEKPWDDISAELTRLSGQPMSYRTVQKYSLEIQKARKVAAPNVGRIFKKSMDIEGQRFGRLVATGKTGEKWDCICDCGGSKQVLKSSLVRGLTKSCGCIKKGVRIKEV